MSVVEEVHEDGYHGHMLELQGVIHHVTCSGPMGDDEDGMLLSVLYSGGAAVMTVEDLRAMHRFLGTYLDALDGKEPEVDTIESSDLGLQPVVFRECNRSSRGARCSDPEHWEDQSTPTWEEHFQPPVGISLVHGFKPTFQDLP